MVTTMTHKIAVLIALSLLASSAAASPYESLSTALHQQAMINDLRTQCRIPQNVTDEKIKAVFLASQANHQTLLEAADALRANDRTRYAQTLSAVQCPDLM